MNVNLEWNIIETVLRIPRRSCCRAEERKEQWFGKNSKFDNWDIGIEGERKKLSYIELSQHKKQWGKWNHRHDRQNKESVIPE